MRWLTGIVTVFVMAVVAIAAPPTITAPPNVYGPPGEWVEIRVETSGKWVRYRPLDSGLRVFPNDKLKDANTTWVAGDAGKRYRMLAYTGNDDGGAEVEITIVFGGDIGPNPPNPNPNPNPNPIPPPKPVTIDDFWIIMVEETSLRTPAVAKVLGDINYWKTLPGSGVAFYDKDQPEAKKYKYDVQAMQSGIPLPVVMLVDNRQGTKGNLIKALALPTGDNAQKEIRDFVKANTGK